MQRTSLMGIPACRREGRAKPDSDWLLRADRSPIFARRSQRLCMIDRGSSTATGPTEVGPLASARDPGYSMRGGGRAAHAQSDRYLVAISRLTLHFAPKMPFADFDLQIRSAQWL